CGPSNSGKPFSLPRAPLPRYWIWGQGRRDRASNRDSTAEAGMAKKREQQTEEDELESIEVTIGPARGGSYALMSPINMGKSVNLRPSAETVAEMKRRGVTRVTASWDRSKKNGQVRQLTIRPANPGGGLKVRYDGNMRPCIHVPTRNMGTA